MTSKESGPVCPFSKEHNTPSSVSKQEGMSSERASALPKHLQNMLGAF
jgi:hypothetical protein